jgi:hypothetical protein
VPKRNIELQMGEYGSHDSRSYEHLRDIIPAILSEDYFVLMLCCTLDIYLFDLSKTIKRAYCSMLCRKILQ